MKAVIIGDQHVADRAPSSRIDDYRQAMLDKLTWIVGYSNDMGADCILNLGDVFHIKRPDRNSHYLVGEVAKIFGQSKAPVIIAPGNHDLTSDSLESIPSQPLGTLALHPNITLLMGASKEFPLFGVPYVDPTPENLSRWTEAYHAVDGPTKYPFMITHQAIFPAAEDPEVYTCVTAEDWVSEFGAEYVAYGHIHSRMKAGFAYEIDGCTFLNNGAISRGSLHEETIHRKLAVTLFDDSKKSGPQAFTSVPIPYKPAEEVFDLKAVALEKGNKAQVAGFLDSLGSAELNHLTVEAILEKAREAEGLSKIAVAELEDIVTSVMTN